MEIVKRILLVSHCILNNASKVELDEAGLAEEYKLRSEFDYRKKYSGDSASMSGIYYVWLTEVGACEKSISTSILQGAVQKAS